MMNIPSSETKPFWHGERTQRALVWVALPLAVYAVVAVLITWPLARHVDDHAAGLGVADTFEVTRHIWWARESLLDGRFPFDQTALVYPEGFTSWVMWSHPLQYLPAALLALVVSPLAAFNLMLMAVLVLNGTSAYWLGMALTGRRVPPALLGGLAFLAFPTVQGHLSVGHLGIVSLYPLPLFALSWWRIACDGAGWRTVLAGGGWFALTALAYVSQLVYVLMPLIAFSGLYWLIWDRQRLVRLGQNWHDQPALKLVAMILVGGALLLPFYAPLLTSEGRSELADVAEPGRVTFSADPLAFVSPSPFGVLDEVGLVPGYARDVLGTNSAEGTAYLGVVALGLALVALFRRPDARLWAAVALGAMVLSLGPLLKWRDEPVVFRVEDFKSYVTLPWALLQGLPLLDATRTPGRFNLATGLAISALVSLGAGVLLARLSGRWRQIALVAVLGTVMAAEYQLFAPFRTGDARQPDYFRTLAQADDVRAVLNLPANHSLAAKIALYQQTLHHHPLIAGHALRRTPQDPALLAVLERVVVAPGDLGPDAVRYLLSQAGADRVVIHTRFYPDPAAVVALVRDSLGAPGYQDELVAVFAVPRVDDPPDGLEPVIAWAADAWSEAIPLGDGEGRFMGAAGTLYLYADAPVYRDVVIPVQSYRTPRRIAVWLDDHLINAQWIGAGAMRLVLQLDPGYHALRFQALDGCTPYPFALSCWDSPDSALDCPPIDPPLCISTALGAPAWIVPDTPLAAVDARLDHGLRLRAYSAAPLADAVEVRLFWEAARPLPEDYALFVHLADPATGEPLAQYDGFPLVMTGDWEAGTRWQSVVQVPLPDDLPAGTYALNVGWFDPKTGARLAVKGEGPWEADGILTLRSIELDPGH